jgi:hypothetical protein
MLDEQYSMRNRRDEFSASPGDVFLHCHSAVADPFS